MKYTQTYGREKLQFMCVNHLTARSRTRTHESRICKQNRGENWIPNNSTIIMNMMLCFNVKLAAFFRAYRDESVRDRSHSLCTPPSRAPPNRDIGALRVLQRRASSVM